MNRIRALYGPDGADEPVLGDYVIVSGRFGWSRVTHETAHRIERQLARFWSPRWLVFTDCVGSRIRVRTCDIQLMVESTAAQRAADRQLDRSRRLEEKADRRPWENHD